MSKRKLMSLGLIFLLLAVFSATELYAKECSHGKKEGHGYDFGKKVLGKMHFAMANKEELALSEDQYQKIKALKIDIKKNLIKRTLWPFPRSLKPGIRHHKFLEHLPCSLLKDFYQAPWEAGF